MLNVEIWTKLAFPPAIGYLASCMSGDCPHAVDRNFLDAQFRLWTKTRRKARRAHGRKKGLGGLFAALLLAKIFLGMATTRHR